MAAVGRMFCVAPRSSRCHSMPHVPLGTALVLRLCSLCTLFDYFLALHIVFHLLLNGLETSGFFDHP